MTREQALPIIGLCLKATVIALLVAEGAAARPGDIARAFRNVTLLARAFLAAHVAVPVITLLALLAVRPQQNVVVALAILASCPVAPLLIVRLSKAGGRPSQVMALHLALTVLALAVMPLSASEPPHSTAMVSLSHGNSCRSAPRAPSSSRRAAAMPA